MIETPSFLSIPLYNLIGTYSQIILYMYNLYQFKEKKHLPSKRIMQVQSFFAGKPKFQHTFLAGSRIWILLEIILFSYVQYGLIGLMNTTFGNIVGTGANYFGLLSTIPLVLFGLCFVLWVDPMKQLDLLAPAYPLALVFSKIACFCSGCCAGFSCSWGLFNHRSGYYEFPAQLLEAAAALAIFIILLRLRGKARTGSLMPIYIILFSGIRFFTEFTRGEENVLWIFKIYHFCCIGGLIFGTILLLLVRKYSDRLSRFFECRMPAGKTFGADTDQCEDGTKDEKTLQKKQKVTKK